MRIREIFKYLNEARRVIKELLSGFITIFFALTYALEKFFSPQSIFLNGNPSFFFPPQCSHEYEYFCFSRDKLLVENFSPLIRNCIIRAFNYARKLIRRIKKERILCSLEIIINNELMTSDPRFFYRARLRYQWMIEN